MSTYLFMKIDWFWGLYGDAKDQEKPRQSWYKKEQGRGTNFSTYQDIYKDKDKKEQQRTWL